MSLHFYVYKISKKVLHKTYTKCSVFLRYFDGTRLSRVGRQKVPEADLLGVRRPTNNTRVFLLSCSLNYRVPRVPYVKNKMQKIIDNTSDGHRTCSVEIYETRKKLNFYVRPSNLLLFQ